jgi:two-component system, LytTR family, sensor kinase
MLALYAGWWILWSLIQCVVLHRIGLSWELSVLDAVVSNLLLALACMIAVILYRFYRPGVGNSLFWLVFALAITFLMGSTFKWLMSYLVLSPDYLLFVESSMPVRFVFSMLVLSFVSMMFWMWTTFHERAAIEARNVEAGRLVKEAELVYLRQQLQPHFLFNSLNSISALAGKPNEARKMIQQLSDFLRGTLRKDEQRLISLREELEHLELYLDIEKVRFGDRLSVEVDVAKESLAAQIPPLTLQPLVENAIKFGLYDTLDKVIISIKAQPEPGFLSVTVENPFDESTQQSVKGTGFGLGSVQRRLYLIYTRNDLLVTEKRENIFITRLKIPQA